jgi:uncharacterized protein
MSRPWVISILCALTTVNTSWSGARASALAPPAPPGAADGELKRSAFLGTKLAPLSDEAREGAKLGKGDGGVLVDDVFPQSSAAAAGLKKGDVIVTVDGAKAEAPAWVVDKLATRKAGDALKLELVRDGKRTTETLTLKGRPLETSDDFDVTYGSVESKGRRLRTIVTKPRTAGKHPALFFIQGIGLYSIDNPTGAIGSYRTILDDFTRRGWVTLRVEKPGVGDSEGGPGSLVDFDVELDGYLQGLKMLKKMDAVDPTKVVIFGHSMGGVMAPLLANDEPVRGIAVYGTIGKTWIEYALENFRRQTALADVDPGEIDKRMRIEAAYAHHLCVEKMSPRQIAEKFPELKAHVDQVAPDGISYFGRHYTFFQQLAAKELGDAWSRFGGDALAMWGKCDFVSSEGDHALIAEIVNLDHPGHGVFAPIAGADHGFARAESYRDARQRSSPPEFNTAVLETLRAWSREL